MRLHFPNAERPKKAAKLIANRLAVPLATAHRAVARACGYSDWYEFGKLVNAGPVCELDQELDTDRYVQRRSNLVLAISRELQAPLGDVQYVLGETHVTGERCLELNEEITIRLACWRVTGLPIVGRRQRGAIGTIKSPGRNGEVVILSNYGQPTHVVTHDAVATVANFEYTTPKVPRDLFLPMRLYMPYGYWTEHDGACVVFSRDYKPMWRLREGQRPERLDPWLWIDFKDQTHIWPDWRSPAKSSSTREIADRFLRENGIHRLPILADGLPLLIHAEDVKMEDAAELLQAQRNSSPPSDTTAPSARIRKRRRAFQIVAQLPHPTPENG